MGCVMLGGEDVCVRLNSPILGEEEASESVIGESSRKGGEFTSQPEDRAASRRARESGDSGSRGLYGST